MLSVRGGAVSLARESTTLRGTTARYNRAVGGDKISMKRLNDRILADDKGNPYLDSHLRDQLAERLPDHCHRKSRG